MDVRRLRLIDGHPTSGPGWVYIWMWPDGIRYIGATWLDPAVRTEMHLNRETRDPRSLAIRSAVAQHGEPTLIAAIEVPEGSDRQVLKVALIGACDRAGLLGINFIGAGQHEPADGVTNDPWIRDAVSTLSLDPPMTWGL